MVWCCILSLEVIHAIMTIPIEEDMLVPRQIESILVPSTNQVVRDDMSIAGMN